MSSLGNIATRAFQSVRRLKPTKAAPNGLPSLSFVERRCWITDDSSSPSDRLHSTDIAFKPAESGWGGGSRKYETNFDRIFGSKSKTTNESTPTTLDKPNNSFPTKI